MVPTETAFRLAAGAQGLFFANTKPVEVDPGTADVRLVWEQPRARLRVRVLDAVTEAALAGAEVVFAKQTSQGTSTTRGRCDADGDAHGPWVGAGAMRVSVFAKGHAYDHATIELEPDERGERLHVTFGRTLARTRASIFCSLPF